MDLDESHTAGFPFVCSFSFFLFFFFPPITIKYIKDGYKKEGVVKGNVGCNKVVLYSVTDADVQVIILGDSG